MCHRRQRLPPFRTVPPFRSPQCPTKRSRRTSVPLAALAPAPAPAPGAGAEAGAEARAEAAARGAAEAAVRGVARLRAAVPAGVTGPRPMGAEASALLCAT
eukprot:COSAG01_NODE_2249_length_8073_cov_2.946973_6_plen_101_part_00